MSSQTSHLDPNLQTMTIIGWRAWYSTGGPHTEYDSTTTLWQNLPSKGWQAGVFYCQTRPYRKILMGTDYYFKRPAEASWQFLGDAEKNHRYWREKMADGSVFQTCTQEELDAALVDIPPIVWSSNWVKEGKEIALAKFEEIRALAEAAWEAPGSLEATRTDKVRN